MNQCATFTISGREFKKVRRMAGYSAREVGEFFASRRAGKTSERSVYRLEERRAVASRYSSLLEDLVGTKPFKEYLGQIRDDAERRRQRTALSS
jgi:hypothetical protein